MPARSTTERASRSIEATRTVSPSRAWRSIVASAVRVAREPPETWSVKVSSTSPMVSIWRAGFWSVLETRT